MIRQSMGTCPVSTLSFLLSPGELDLDCRRCLEQNSSIKMKDLAVYVGACLATKIQDCRSNISLLSRSTYETKLAYQRPVYCHEKEN
jgi:hypothetical protein